MHISCLSNSRMQPEDLLIFRLKDHHLLYKIIVKPSLHLFSERRNSCFKSEQNISHQNWFFVVFFASQNWFVEIKTRSTTFIFWPPQDYQPFEIKTTTNASSFVILDCRKSNNSCWLSRLLIGSRAWSKGKSCWSHFIIYKSNFKWKYQQGIRTYDWSSDSHYFVFISASIHDLRLT